MSDKLAQSLGVEPKDRLNYKRKSKWRDWIVIGCILLVVLFFRMNFTLIEVSGHSMDPTLHDGQRILVRHGEKVKRFDIVVLRERVVDEGDETIIVKRVIGLPGDKIKVVDGQLYVNDQLVKEDYISDSPRFATMRFETTVPNDHVFVLGDNRDNSRDSRLVGNFKLSSIIGVMLFQ